MVSGDFDEDGVPDLVCVYSGPAGGVLTFHRGNVDSIYPNSPEARQRRAAGDFTEAPFLFDALTLSLPVGLDYLGAGDFDADGHWDVVGAAQGGNLLHFIRGDGRGGFSTRAQIELAGSVTALATGEINRADGLNDIVVGISDSRGARLLVFEGPGGALGREPESLALAAEARALALGQLDDEYNMDLAVGAGPELLVVHGRDRKLSLDVSLRDAVPQVVVSKRSFESAVASIALGSFTGNGRREIATLLSGGEVKIAGVRSGRKGGGLSALTLPGEWGGASRLVRAKVSSLPYDDLVLVDQADRRIRILGGGKVKGSPGDAAAALDAADEPVAVLPMRLNADALNDLVILGKGQRGPTVVMTAPASSFVVNSSGDGEDCSPSDGVCSTGSFNQQTGRCALTNECTLRAAIQQANASPGADAITFGVSSIALSTELPTVLDAVTIDGTASSGGRVELRGNNSVGLALGIGAPSCVVRGMALNSFRGHNCCGTISLGNIGSGSNIVEGNLIGTDVTGTVALGNSGRGVGIHCPNNVIGGTSPAARNVISNGGGSAVEIGTSGNTVQGNYIGTDVKGVAAMGNLGRGVMIVAGSNNVIGGVSAAARNLISANVIGVDSRGAMTLIQGNFIGTTIDGNAALGNVGGAGVSGDDNTVGGVTPGARNIISGNTSSGLGLSNTKGTIVQGNYIGTNAAGTADLGNALYGVHLTHGSSNNSIGGLSPGAGNIISGNDDFGVVCTGGISITNFIQGNYIGTDAGGTAALGNTKDGIIVSNAASVIIGGGAAGARNIISGNNGDGIEIFGSFTTGIQVAGNYIGTRADGTGALPNSGHGVFVTNSASNNTIGGPNNAGNVIQNNTSDGVYIDSGSGNVVAGNSIFGNGGLGIDLGFNGVNANDSGDADAGANGLQNFPVLAAVISGGGKTTIQGALNSRPDATFRLDFYAGGECDTAGFGEGQIFLGAASVTTDGAGNASFNTSLPVGVPAGRTVTATATDANNNTSEFSQCRAAIAATKFKLKVNITGLGSGRVTSTPPGIECVGQSQDGCEFLFDAGGEVRLDAAPTDAGSLFSHWEMDCAGSEPRCLLKMDGDKEVTAVFARVDFQDLSRISQASINATVLLEWRLQIQAVLAGRDASASPYARKTNQPRRPRPAEVENVKIELSRDGGASFETMFSSTPNDGSECWAVTGPATSQALIRISAAGNPGVGGTSGQLFKIIGAAGGGAAQPLFVGAANCAGLTAGDQRSQIRGGAFYADRYSMAGAAGQRVALTLTSSAFDVYLYLFGPDGAVIAQDDNGGGGTDARIPAANGFITLPVTGTYVIEATSFAANSLGGYHLRLDGAPMPVLLTEEGTEGAIALDSVTMVRDPFPLGTSLNFSPDRRTRVLLFAVNAELLPGEDGSVVTAQAEDLQHRVYPLEVEFVGRVPNFDWLTQVSLKLPDELANKGDVRVSIALRGVTSNKVLIRLIQSIGNPP